jgi:ADP-ribose pyrophosphatase YjhB (NUDIX family)
MTDEPREVFNVVNEHDEVIGEAFRADVHAQGLRHRAVSIFVFNSAGQLLMQLRSATKDEYPSCWTSSCSGHVDAGEDYDTAAHRELMEELGLSRRTRDGQRIHCPVSHNGGRDPGAASGRDRAGRICRRRRSGPTGRTVTRRIHAAVPHTAGMVRAKQHLSASAASAFAARLTDRVALRALQLVPAFNQRSAAHRTAGLAVGVFRWCRANLFRVIV